MVLETHIRCDVLHCRQPARFRFHSPPGDEDFLIGRTYHLLLLCREHAARMAEQKFGFIDGELN